MPKVEEFHLIYSKRWRGISSAVLMQNHNFSKALAESPAAYRGEFHSF
jgi:hypothetical protein